MGRSVCTPVQSGQHIIYRVAQWDWCTSRIEKVVWLSDFGVIEYKSFLSCKAFCMQNNKDSDWSAQQRSLISFFIMFCISMWKRYTSQIALLVNNTMQDNKGSDQSAQRCIMLDVVQKDLKGVNHEQAAFLVAAAHDLHLLSFESWWF